MGSTDNFFPGRVKGAAAVVDAEAAAASADAAAADGPGVVEEAVVGVVTAAASVGDTAAVGLEDVDTVEAPTGTAGDPVPVRAAVDDEVTVGDDKAGTDDKPITTTPVADVTDDVGEGEVAEVVAEVSVEVAAVESVVVVVALLDGEEATEEALVVEVTPLEEDESVEETESVVVPLLEAEEAVVGASWLVVVVDEAVVLEDVALVSLTDEAAGVEEVAELALLELDEAEVSPGESVHVFTSRTASFPLASLIGVRTMTQVSVMGPAAVLVVWVVVTDVGTPAGVCLA